MLCEKLLGFLDLSNVISLFSPLDGKELPRVSTSYVDQDLINLVSDDAIQKTLRRTPSVPSSCRQFKESFGDDKLFLYHKSIQSIGLVHLVHFPWLISALISLITKVILFLS